MEQQRAEDEDLLLDIEAENSRYREKVQQQVKTLKEVQEQLEAYTNNSDEKNYIAKLVEKQNVMIKQLQENDKSSLDAKLEKIDYHWENLIKGKVIENIIPPKLHESMHFDSLSKLNTLNQSMYRAMLMFRYICEKQLPNVENMYGGGGDEEIEKKMQFVKMMVTIANQAVSFINAS